MERETPKLGKAMAQFAEALAEYVAETRGLQEAALRTQHQAGRARDHAQQVSGSFQLDPDDVSR